MTDMIFRQLSDNVKDIENEVVRKLVKAILAETDADVITIKKRDYDGSTVKRCVHRSIYVTNLFGSERGEEGERGLTRCAIMAWVT